MTGSVEFETKKPPTIRGVVHRRRMSSPRALELRVDVGGPETAPGVLCGVGSAHRRRRCRIVDR